MMFHVETIEEITRRLRIDPDGSPYPNITIKLDYKEVHRLLTDNMQVGTLITLGLLDLLKKHD